MCGQGGGARALLPPTPLSAGQSGRPGEGAPAAATAAHVAIAACEQLWVQLVSGLETK